MTEKRFKVFLDINNQYTIKDNRTQEWYQGLSKIKSFKLVELLNKLNEENNALKSDRYRFEEEAKLFALSELDKVFTLIDKKIREYSSLEQRERTSSDTIEILKELKKELIE